MEGQTTPTPISTRLTSLRRMQAIGQLLVALGGFLAFMSLSQQIPLLAQQASIVQSLQNKVNQLQRKTFCGNPDELIY